MIDWSQIRLAVFDVDGTLYSQRHVRNRMAIQLALACLRHRTLVPIRVIRYYRVQREKLAEREVRDFEAVLLNDTAKAVGVPIATVAAVIDTWIEQRPLALLRRARYARVERVFAALRARGIVIGVLSDYPATAKLAALGLDADLVIWAGQSFVGVLKPNPRGLQKMLDLAGVDAAQAVMIGDRDERDGEIARRTGVAALIRSSRVIGGTQTFASYDRAPFDTLHDQSATPVGMMTRLIRYCATGGLAALVELATFAIMLRYLKALVFCAVVSWLVAVAVNYTATSKFVFRRNPAWRDGARFVAGASFGFCANLGITLLFSIVLGVYPPIAKVIGITAAFGLNFAINALWVFHPRNLPQRPEMSGQHHA